MMTDESLNEPEALETMGALMLLRNGLSEYASICKYLDHAIRLMRDRTTALAVPSGTGQTWWYTCNACNSAVNPGDRYCHECGKALIWKED